ncbi:MAG: hypothetical protein HPY83_10780 [Anaerolineae bacterium]|nr:hypothetical protein [Anaerolineae bacterium]
MAEERMGAVERWCQGQGGELNFLREAVRQSVPELMEEEVKALVGAGRYEGTEERTTYRNGVGPTDNPGAYRQHQSKKGI